MNHPLTGNLSDLSDTDLANKIAELNKRITFGYRTGNTAFVGQASLLLNDYMSEQKRRTDEYIKKLQDSDDTSKKWDDIIDI